MAYIQQEYCRKCEEVTYHINSKCRCCRAREYKQATAAWNSLSNDEKFSDIRKRLETIEAGPIQYGA